MGRRSHASDAPSVGRDNSITGGCSLSQLMGKMPIILIEVRGRDRERGDPSDVANMQPGHNAPGPSSAVEVESAVRDQADRGDQGNVAERQPKAPQPISEGDNISEEARDTVQSGRQKRKHLMSC